MLINATNCSINHSVWLHGSQNKIIWGRTGNHPTVVICLFCLASHGQPAVGSDKQWCSPQGTPRPNFVALALAKFSDQPGIGNHSISDTVKIRKSMCAVVQALISRYACQNLYFHTYFFELVPSILVGSIQFCSPSGLALASDPKALRFWPRLHHCRGVSQP